ncbi:ribosomal-processing cysteine protease Prp [Murimonas intestini]|uniref:Ribosomal processing cysteine protease Prp n=1 Tax=Murimonas intestini TaxID=1337051 RepID=A0AB73TAV6_9FIRM|nr:ribosomal-processing cysteine protease Prp [Murimonas intestini]MCR1838854.1 ribosomal-processing cysteine protease Prp [Murimonas intestini]MCR1864154.1 ribosomal-processing cysteine protease Prp [Murimonas intestini]MCR1881764.1 ribosomal-processing cysteine protease Prp [Murimonas intestini]
MITITVYKNEDQQYEGFLSEGHAGYGTEGSDIICAAVSVLTVNAINSIEKFTADRFAVRQDDGLLELVLEGVISKETSLLLDSMVLGLMDIQKNYGNEYIKLIFEEV